jgi:hypothetical protein
MKTCLVLNLVTLILLNVANAEIHNDQKTVSSYQGEIDISKKVKKHLNLDFTTMEQSDQVWNWEDSTWENTEKEIYTFDESGNQTEYIYQNWIQSEWIDLWRNVFTYDDNGNLIIDANQQWNGSEWIDYRIRYYTYDNDGNEIEVYDIVRGAYNLKSISEYDNNSNLTLRLAQYWQNDDWQNASKYTYTYDTDGYLFEYLSQMWENSEWVNYYNNLYEYDINGKLTEKETKYWLNSTWINQGKYTYVYDANGNQTEELRQGWRNEEWLNSEKYLSNYDFHGNLIEYITQYWYDTYWQNMGKDSYTYDEASNQIEKLVQSWFDPEWINRDKFTTTYDKTGKKTEYLSQDWSRSSSIWENRQRTTYVYDPALFIEEKVREISTYALSSKNYPNPFNPSTIIEFYLPVPIRVRIDIYTISGQYIQTILNQSLTRGIHKEEFNAQNLPSGVYFYLINAGDLQTIGRMILIR